MRTLILRGWILAVVVEWLVASPGHAGPSVIRDRAFLDADWTLTTFGVGNGGSVEADQASMGNPAPSRRIRTMVNSAPSPSEFSSVTGVNLFGGAVYDPQAQGAFVDLDYFEDALLEQGFGDGQATGIALRQNGNVYVRQVGTTPEFAWTAKKISGVTATQFALVFEGGEDVNVHPDFSASGAPIEFGFMRRNSTSVGANGYQIVALIDNWTVLINTPCAQDADCVYPDACFPGSCVSGVCTATMVSAAAPPSRAMTGIPARSMPVTPAAVRRRRSSATMASPAPSTTAMEVAAATCSRSTRSRRRSRPSSRSWIVHLARATASPTGRARSC
jgi:hypothetical protein